MPKSALSPNLADALSYTCGFPGLNCEPWVGSCGDLAFMRNLPYGIGIYIPCALI